MLIKFTLNKHTYPPIRMRNIQMFWDQNSPVHAPVSFTCQPLQSSTISLDPFVPIPANFLLRNFRISLCSHSGIFPIHHNFAGQLCSHSCLFPTTQFHRITLTLLHTSYITISQDRSDPIPAYFLHHNFTGSLCSHSGLIAGRVYSRKMNLITNQGGVGRLLYSMLAATQA